MPGPMAHHGMMRNLARARHNPGGPEVYRSRFHGSQDKVKRKQQKGWFPIIVLILLFAFIILFAPHPGSHKSVQQETAIQTETAFLPDIREQSSLSEASVPVKQNLAFENHDWTTGSQSHKKEETKMSESDFLSCMSTKEYEKPRDDEAYITFLTGNQGGYIAGVLTLAYNLELVGAKRPLVVMTLADVPEVELEYLHKAGLKTIPVPSLPNPNCRRGQGRPCNRGRDNYSKIAVFSLVQYRRLVYLDSDMVISSNIDELFCFSAFTSCKINTCTAEDCHKLNSGILVVHPEAEVFQDMLTKYTVMKSYNSGDQGFLTTYFDQPSAPPRNFIEGQVYNVKVKSTDKRNCDPDMVEHMRNNGPLAKVRHFMDATKPWVWYYGREMQDWGKTKMVSTNVCFQMTMDVWEANYRTVLDKFEGLEEHLKKTVTKPVSDSRNRVWRGEEDRGDTFVSWRPRKRDNGDRKGGDMPALPKSADGLKVTVAILNWKRPQNLLQMLPIMVKYEAVAEILVWHCNNETVFEYDHPKVRHIVDPAANDRWGMNTRYKNCLQAKTSQVLTVDDDVLPPEGTVNSLLLAAKDQPNRIHSLHGRNPGPGCKYNFVQARPGPAMVGLTKVMLVDRQLCSDYFEYTDMMEEVAHQGKPYWNGEDIYMSLVSTKVTGNQPVRHKLPYTKLQGQEVGISYSLEKHVDFRTVLIRAATSKLGIQC